MNSFKNRLAQELLFHILIAEMDEKAGKVDEKCNGRLSEDPWIG